MCFTICAFHFLAILYNNTNQSATAFVYDLFHGVLKFFLAVIVNFCNFARYAIIDKLF